MTHKTIVSVQYLALKFDILLYLRYKRVNCLTRRYSTSISSSFQSQMLHSLYETTYLVGLCPLARWSVTKIDDTRVDRSFWTTRQYVCVSVISIFHSSHWHFTDKYDERTHQVQVLLRHLLIKSGIFFCIRVVESECLKAGISTKIMLRPEGLQGFDTFNIFGI